MQDGSSARQQWFARMVQVGLDEDIVRPAQLLRHVTTDVLAQHLPPEVLASLLEAALAGGSLGPDRLVEAIGSQSLVDHVPLDVLWRCIDDGAERAGVAVDAGNKALR